MKIEIEPVIAALVLLLSLPAAARAPFRPGSAVKDADRACKTDADCAVVVPKFQCMYCARPGDWESGVVAAANKRRAKAYAPKPTAAQLRSCATAGPCAQTGEAKAVCRERLCAVDYAPRGE